MESCAVASLVASHLMNGVMDRVKVQLFCTFGNILFVLASTGLSHHTFLKVRLGIPNELTEQLSEARSVISLLECVTAESLSDLRIALAVGLTSHSQILSYFGALTHKVCTQTIVDDRILYVLSYAKHMFASPYEAFALVGNFPLNDLFALRATLRCLGALVYITTDRANKFLVHKVDI